MSPAETEEKNLPTLADDRVTLKVKLSPEAYYTLQQIRYIKGVGMWEALEEGIFLFAENLRSGKSE